MYEAMRQRAPNSTQFAGVATTALVLALAGYALANGIGGEIMKAIEPRTVVAIVPPPVEKVEPPEKYELDTTVDLGIPAPPVPDDVFEATDRSSPIAIEPGPTEGGSAAVSPAPSPLRAPPKLLKAPPPPYPPISERAREQGTTRLEVCVDARGRVTSANLAQTSGHPRLDEAALKWVRSARFTPGSAGGAPQSVCGHDVFYEWKIENARG